MTTTRARGGPAGGRLRLVAAALGVLLALPSCDDGTAEGAAPTSATATSPAPAAPAAPSSTAPAASAPTGPPASATPEPSESSAGTETASGLRFAVVGDSITAGFAAVEGATVNDRSSWIPFAVQHRRLDFVGGYAVPGATTAVMRDGVSRVDADVLVVMGGTNDLGEDVPWEVIRDNLVQIVEIAGVPTVLLSAIPPRDDEATGVLQLNAQLAELAIEQGWGFVDPWSGMSDDGSWIAGASDDGIHPVEQVVSLVGERLAAAMSGSG
ncbi:SGNH/GDSL hydrolase family protein [Geodermatophilus sabuli]|uniref:SGNH/GDSL hydrolase family protein n=1 Tax=Geodermatophilus sabuli TaxID=1564158 RepID=UPI000BE48A31|nr:SGNH/GDSL hydrolase family protein [Geodermatophilus sabuli]MBB3084786.1 lysophospholipase L1-like esterase [Geodermatophilus sabuli]